MSDDDELLDDDNAWEERQRRINALVQAVELAKGAGVPIKAADVVVEAAQTFYSFLKGE